MNVSGEAVELKGEGEGEGVVLACSGAHFK